MGELMNRWFTMARQVGELPDGYRGLTYITGDGAYINTADTIKQGDKVTLKFLTASTTSEQYVFGWRRSGGYADPYQLLVAMNAGSRTIVAGKANQAAAIGTTSAWAFGTDNTLIIDTAGNSITVNGTTPSGLLYDLSNGAAFDENGSSDRVPFLAAFNRAGTPVGPCTTTRLYLYQVERSGMVIHKFIPCINPNGVYGMYDVPTGTFFTSANSKTFTGA